jgi:hypothetical protein
MAGQMHHLTLAVYFSNDIFTVVKTQPATLTQDGRTKEQLRGRHVKSLIFREPHRMSHREAVDTSINSTEHRLARCLLEYQVVYYRVLYSYPGVRVVGRKV